MRSLAYDTTRFLDLHDSPDHFLSCFRRIKLQRQSCVGVFMMNRKILIGVDTGVNTGFVVAIDHGHGGELIQVESLSITQAMEQVKELLKKTGKDIQLPLIPTDSIVMKVDKEAVRRSGMKIPEALGDSIPEYMTITLRDANGNPKRALYKSELMMLEMLANANWERPIYMAITVGSENHLGMGNHFTQEGLAYRFTPFDTDKLDSKIDSEKMYDNLMNKFKFGGIDKPGIYIDENVMRMCYTHRRIFTQLVGQLIKEGKKDKALAALDYAEKMIPAINVPYDWANGAFQMAESYYQLGQNEKANKIIDELANKSLEYMIWYLSLNDNQLAIAGENFVYNASLLDAEVRLMEKYKSEELAKHYSTQLDQLYNEYVTRMKGK